MIKPYIGSIDQWNVVSDDDEEYDDSHQDEDTLMGSPTGEADV